MDGIHDMGGMDGFGPVKVEVDEPVFHTSWDRRVFAMARALRLSGAWGIDESRAAGEQLPPEVYLRSSYYERWLAGIETNLVEHGIADGDELAAGHSLRAGVLPKRAVTLEAVAGAAGRALFSREIARPAHFQLGDQVRARNIHPVTHTRLPRYVRGHLGVVELIHGCHVFPDAVVSGRGEDPQWLYTVRFSGTELWGEEADPLLSVSVDAFEPYLEPA